MIKKISMAKIIGWIVVVAIIVALCSLLAWRIYDVIRDDTSDNQAEVEKSVPLVVLEPVEQFSQAREQLQVIGLVEPSQALTLKSSIGSRIERIVVGVGQDVTKDEVLIELDRLTLENQVELATSALDELKTQRADLGASTNTQASRQLDIAIEQAENQLEQVQHMFDAAGIVAPFTGRISEILVAVGEQVGPGQPIISIVSADQKQVVTFLSEQERKLIDEQSQVILEQGSTGTIIEIAPEVDDRTRKIKTIIDITDKEEDLLLGEYIYVEISMRGDALSSGVYLLPFSSVAISEGKALVYSLDSEEKILAHEVITGKVIGSHIEVISGIEETMSIITNIRGLSAGQQAKLQ